MTIAQNTTLARNDKTRAWIETAMSEFSYIVDVLALEATTPKFTFGAGAPVAFVDWGDGTAYSPVTNGVEMSHTYTLAGEYNVRLVMEDQPTYLTQVDISADHVVVPDSFPVLLKLTAFTRLIDMWAVGFGQIGVMKIAR